MAIDLEPNDETRAVVRGVTEFADRHAGPLAGRWPHFLADERTYLREDGRLADEVVEAFRSLKRTSGEAGYYAMAMPEEVGGGGRPLVDVALAMVELCRRGTHFHPAVLAFVEGPSHMLLAMDEAQRERWLTPLVRGEKSTAFCLTEPGAGSDLSALSTRAQRKNGAWVLDGTKTFITNAPYAHSFEVFARTSGERGLEGLSLFMVDRDTPGLDVGAVQQSIIADGLQADVRLDNVELTDEHLVGEEGAGFLLAIQNIGLTRVMIGAICVGFSKFCIEQAVGYARGREAFGKPIGKLQGISFPLADAATKVHAAEQMLLHCAWKLDRGEEAVRESSMVKLYCTEVFNEVADVAVQVHGGNGLMRELPLEGLYRYARLLRVPEGTSEIQRWTIAKTLGL